MSKKQSRRIVIDASVARAAGPEKSVHPTGKSCRDFLLEVLNVCHRIVWTDAIQEEWHKHQSGFARTWMVSMHARKKVDVLDVSKDSALRTAIEDSTVAEKHRETMLKDCHLIEAAIAADDCVASLDDSARKRFRDESKQVAPLRKVIWVNPGIDDETAIDWLTRGAPSEPSRALGIREVRDRRQKK